MVIYVQGVGRVDRRRLPINKADRKAAGNQSEVLEADDGVEEQIKENNYCTSSRW